MLIETTGKPEKSPLKSTDYIDLSNQFVMLLKNLFTPKYSSTPLFLPKIIFTDMKKTRNLKPIRFSLCSESKQFFIILIIWLRFIRMLYTTVVP